MGRGNSGPGLSWGAKIQKLAVFQPERAFFAYIDCDSSLKSYYRRKHTSHTFFSGFCISFEAMPSGGSHPRYARDLRALVEADLKAGVRLCDIARAHKVS